MAKFDLKAAKAEMAQARTMEPMAAGYHRVKITQVAEVGLQPGYQADDEPKESLGVVFENHQGQQVAKVMALSVHARSNLGQILSVVESDVEDLADLLGQELVLEIEKPGQWPKIQGYFPLEDGLSVEPELSSNLPSFYYVADEPAPDILKQLHPQLKQAISSRIRRKEA